MNENSVTVEQLLQIIGDKEVQIAVLRGAVANLQQQVAKLTPAKPTAEPAKQD